MKALSVRQPYAWLIVAGHKPIENRTWTVEHRGPLLIHASLKLHERSIPDIERRYNVMIPRDALQFGGIVGAVELVDIVTRSTSIWFEGPYGWVLSKPRIVPFRKWRGSQGLFAGPKL